MRVFTILTCILFLGTADLNAATKADVAKTWVSVECPDGDITLTLEKDGQLRLRKDWWDAQYKRHTRSVEKSGEWRLVSNVLLMQIDKEMYRFAVVKDVEVRMGGQSALIPTIKPFETNPDDPFDLVSLYEQKKLDGFFMEVLAGR